MGCPDFFLIENDFQCSLLLAYDFSIQDKVFGRIWWNIKFTFFWLSFESRKVHLYVLNMTQDAVFMFEAEGKSLGLASFLFWGWDLISKMASFPLIFHHPRRGFLPLWCCWQMDRTQTKWICCPHSLSHLLLYVTWTCWKKNHWRVFWVFFVVFLFFFSEGFSFIWPEKPFPSAQDPYSPSVGYPDSMAVIHKSDECRTTEHTFVNRAECNGNKISILMK